MPTDWSSQKGSGTTAVAPLQTCSVRLLAVVSFRGTCSVRPFDRAFVMEAGIGQIHSRYDRNRPHLLMAAPRCPVRLSVPVARPSSAFPGPVLGGVLSSHRRRSYRDGPPNLSPATSMQVTLPSCRVSCVPNRPQARRWSACSDHSINGRQATHMNAAPMDASRPACGATLSCSLCNDCSCPPSRSASLRPFGPHGN